MNDTDQNILKQQVQQDIDEAMSVLENFAEFGNMPLINHFVSKALWILGNNNNNIINKNDDNDNNNK